MNFRYKRGSRWVTSTPKIRQGGQWVAVDMPGGPSGWVNTDYLLFGDPPTRSTTAYTSNYSGFQDALDSIGEDTRLVIDDGPYTGNYDLPYTSHITLDGNGSTLNRSNIDDQAIEYDDTGGEFDTNTSPGGDGTYSAGQSTIDVTDASIFSVGDEIRIYDSTQVHPDQPLTTSGTDEGQGMYHVVTDVDTSTDVLTLDEDLFLDWDNPDGNLRVDRVDWGAEDIRITDLTIEGNDTRHGDGTMVFRISYLKGLWYDNCTMQNGVEGLWCYGGYQARVDNCVFDNLGSTRSQGGPYNGYPCTFQAGSHHIYVTDSESFRSGRYGFQVGSGTRYFPTRNGRFENCYVEGGYQRAFDQHPGAHFFEWIDCTAQDTGFFRARSDGCYVRGGGTDGASEYNWYDRQAHNARLSVNQQHYVNISSTNHVYRLLDQRSQDTEKTLFEWRDVWAEHNGSINQFFNFRCDSGTQTIREVIIDHVAINDTWITESNWDDHYSFSGNGTTEIGSTTFDHPTDGTTPSEYFSDECGWTSGQL